MPAGFRRAPGDFPTFSRFEIPIRRSYQEIIDSLGDTATSPQALGTALARKFAHPSAPSGLNLDQNASASELYGLLNFEATHPKRKGKHQRDLTHALMATQSLAEGGMGLQDLRTFPTAGMLGKDNSLKERGQEGPLGIQAGAAAVTTKVIPNSRFPEKKGYGPGDLPEKISAHEEVRVKREISNFERWLKTTGEFEWTSKDPPKYADLVAEIKKRLDAFLKRAGVIQ
jgi:hypothetical protein